MRSLVQAFGMFVLALPLVAAEVYRCGEPKGAIMASHRGHLVEDDGFTGVEPVVVIEGDEMRVVWGDAKNGPSQERVWKAVVVHSSPSSISAVALDEAPAGSALMVYTVDRSRLYLYMSTHKSVEGLNRSQAATYVSKCRR